MYEPSTGWLMLRNSTGGRVKGSVSGSVDSHGYIQVSIKSVKHLAHRIIWLYHYGWLPKMLDHKNGNPLDCRLENLRPASRFQNGFNRPANKNTVSGYKGVTLHSEGRWAARITVKRKQINLGHFSTPEAAHKAYCEAAEKYHKLFKRTQ